MRTPPHPSLPRCRHQFTNWYGFVVALCFCCVPLVSMAADSLLKLGPGDGVRLVVQGQPDMESTLYVAENGTVTVPLAGAVAVAGLAPAAAAGQIAEALKRGHYLNNPQVNLILEQFRSQRFSVLGEVNNPGRFALESHTTALDALAEAGGTTESAGDGIVVLRKSAQGADQRLALDMRGLSDPTQSTSMLALQAGDTVFVPRAAQFFIYGEVNSADMYRLEPNMTIMQAISRGGGLTPRGSTNRIRVERRTAAGKLVHRNASLEDTVHADDVIHIRQRLF